VNILGLDTALGACSVAVVADGLSRAHRFLEMPRGHAEALAPMAESVMREAGMAFAGLDRIAVTTGPGTFTGQRVGLAFARALGLALKIPVIGITTLDAMAEAARSGDGGHGWAIAAADARRDEIYLGARAQARTLMAPRLAALADIASLLAPFATEWGRDVVIAGTAADMIVPLLRDAGFTPRDSGIRQPDAVIVARLAADAPEGPPPRPLYLRPPDAKLPTARA
jgi:tRNA threonylcarbamoyladenosine biosynthesis protein TsaB